MVDSFDDQLSRIIKNETQKNHANAKTQQSKTFFSDKKAKQNKYSIAIQRIKLIIDLTINIFPSKSNFDSQESR